MTGWIEWKRELLMVKHRRTFILGSDRGLGDPYRRRYDLIMNPLDVMARQ
jgi:hypothetical protein